MTDASSEGNRRGEQSAGDSADEGMSWLERFVVATSTILTMLLFAYVIWQGATTPVSAEPTANVTATEALPNGDVKVVVTLQNPQDVGIVMAVVEVDCGTPPPELTFEHLPAEDRRSGYVICPPETNQPSASVST